MKNLANRIAELERAGRPGAPSTVVLRYLNVEGESRERLMLQSPYGVVAAGKEWAREASEGRNEFRRRVRRDLGAPASTLCVYLKRF